MELDKTVMAELDTYERDDALRALLSVMTDEQKCEVLSMLADN